jgi:hypothetical protein
VIRCTSCNKPAVLPWKDGDQDIRPLNDWIYSRDLGWRCPDCGDGPPQHYPDLFPQDPKPPDDVH